MKRILVFLMLAVISMGAYAQTNKGDSSFGLDLGYAFDSENFLIGIDYRINMTDEVRLAPSITHFVKKSNLSAWAFDVNAHYVFPLNEYFAFYPLAGLNLSLWKRSVYVPPHVGKLSDNTTRFGANIGLGGELYVSRELSVGLEMKYLIIKNVDQAMLAIRLGYKF
ncbi:MAG: porin family protein [Tannerellaceae bacterium]|jgi:opacity protein-like surface antigen|nr:porin family protein [Tannerellaceae bacterium]